jgi:uncharacterized protein (DUF1499 family)
LTFAVVVLALAVIVLGVRLYMGRDAEDRVEEGEIVDFATLQPRSATNIFLMCPAAACGISPDAASPVFDMDWERLRDYWSETIAHQPRVKLVAGDGDRRKLTYVQHTAILKFPDIITVEFVSLDDGRKSSFAVESRSRYGKYDFGTNRDRVMTWVRLLQQMIPE